MSHFIQIDGVKIPLQIIIERRNGARVALGRNKIILRIPKPLLFGPEVDKHIKWATNWIQQLKASKPEVLDRFTQKRVYEDGDIFAIGGQNFLLDIKKVDRDSGHVKLLKEGIIAIEIPESPNYDESKLIKKLLIKFAQKYFLSLFIEKVNFYNQKYFQKPISGVRLKYNISNWGSCSTGKNLNFSVRLLFAPDDVIDYVIIHELAHLVEMNHSDRFWKIVADIMPDYREKEMNLKKNSSQYDF
ncbi:MAG: YgjP-like metallopeptidase domain-containing protein [Saprospiraceae bacterium]